MDKHIEEKEPEKKEKKFKTMDLILIVLGVATLLFTLKMISLFETYGSIPDTLVERYFTTVVGEAGFMGLITVFKIWSAKHEFLKKDKDEKKSGTDPDEIPEIESGLGEDEDIDDEGIG